MIKRCQGVGLAQEKRPPGSNLKDVRRAQSVKQMVLYRKQKTIIMSLKKIGKRCPDNEE